MVQVDVFWSYGLGSSFAVAASRQLRRAAASGSGGLLENRFFTRTLLFLAILFAPSGACLLWAFPSWETMHAGSRGLPAWLVTLFAATNVTQGILGFAVVRWLTLKQRPYLAYLQWWLAYFCMFFILVHGWDGVGYRRFFSSTREAFLAWQPSNVGAWFGSDVAITLYLMGVVLIPLLLYWLSTWIGEGHALEGRTAASRPALALYSLGVVFVCGLAPAIGASLLIHRFGWALGAAVAALALYVLCLRRGGLVHRFYERMLA